MNSAEILRLHISEVWGRCDTALARQLYAPNIIDHMPFPDQPPGPEGMIAVLESIHAGIQNLSIEVHEVVDLGDGRALDRWTMRGVHAGNIMGLAATGREIEFNGIDIAKFDNGMMTEIWHVEELLHMLMQMGLTLPVAQSA